MTNIVRAMALCVVAAGAVNAQSPVNADTSAKDSVPAAIRAAARRILPQQAQPGPSNPRLAPDISAVGDFVADVSPKGSTQESACRFCIREVEVAIQAPVDPYFRGDVFLGISDEEGIAIEQAYLTATALPWGLEARFGRFLMPFSKQNTTHRHDLHTLEYPYVVQRFFGPEGLKGTGLYVGKVFSPLGFYQELIVTAVDRVGEAPEGLTTPEPVNKELSGLGYSARLRNYWDLNEATNLELSASAITGEREQPLTTGPNDAIGARQTHVGGDLTFRWRPLQQGNYRSFILQAEFIRQINEKVSLPTFAGPDRDYNGYYTFARWQVTRRGFIGGRFDNVEDPELGGATLRAGSGYLEWFPSEFSKINAAYERLMPTGLPAVNRILLQAAFSVGPHKPHPF
jgi:hypothetical protein